MKKPTTHVQPESQYMPPDERRALGKALREAVPREAHGHWKPAKDRRDIVDLLIESNEGRMPQLVPIRFGRMMQSPFTFYRGSAVVMAADLASTPVSGHSRAGLRRRPSVELRRLRHARAPRRLRHQRSRRDPARARGNGTSSAWPRAWSSPAATSVCPKAMRRGRRAPPCVQLPRTHGRLRVHAAPSRSGTTRSMSIAS